MIRVSWCVTCLQETRLVACGRSDSDPDPPAASRLSPLVRGTINPIFNKHFVPLTKGDSREAAGGQGLSHFYHGLLEFASEERQTAPSIKHRRRHPLKGAAGVVRSTSEQFYVEVDRTAPNPSFATERNLP